MPSSSCFYLYTENLSLPVFSPILAYKKDTCQNLPVPPSGFASLLFSRFAKHCLICLSNQYRRFRAGNGEEKTSVLTESMKKDLPILSYLYSITNFL